MVQEPFNRCSQGEQKLSSFPILLLIFYRFLNMIFQFGTQLVFGFPPQIDYSLFEDRNGCSLLEG